MTPKSSAEVVIVGAGPAGALLAAILLGRGLRVTLIERQKDFAREFRGEVLMPSGVDAIAAAGFESLLQETPTTRPTAVELYYRDRKAARIDFEDVGDRGPVVISQPDLLEALMAHCQREPGFRLLRGTTVNQLASERGRVSGVITSEGVLIPALLVVGADGRGSIVRRRAGLHLEQSSETFDIVWFKCPYPDSLAERGAPAIGVVGGGHLHLGYRSATGPMQMASIIPKGSYRDIRERGLDVWFDELRHGLPAEVGDFALAHREQITDPFVLNVVCHMLPKWTTPGVLLLGDAAHPMSPVGAQGINIALRDVLVAANGLVPALRSAEGPEAIDRACGKIETQRIPEVAKIQNYQRMPPRILFRNRWWSEALIRTGLTVAGSGLLQRAGGHMPPIVQTLFYGDGEISLEV
jgi:2-polyprenyl-6-methoxyphenol hydroxylase-like FAD-dependent oxidoreductase